MERTEEINLRQLALKCRSKKEVYTVKLFVQAPPLSKPPPREMEEILVVELFL